MQADVAMVVAITVAKAAIRVNKFFFKEIPSFQYKVNYVNKLHTIKLGQTPIRFLVFEGSCLLLNPILTIVKHPFQSVSLLAKSSQP